MFLQGTLLYKISKEENDIIGVISWEKNLIIFRHENEMRLEKFLWHAFNCSLSIPNYFIVNEYLEIKFYKNIKLLQNIKPKRTFLSFTQFCFNQKCNIKTTTQLELISSLDSKVWVLFSCSNTILFFIPSLCFTSRPIIFCKFSRLDISIQYSSNVYILQRLHHQILHFKEQKYERRFFPFNSTQS